MSTPDQQWDIVSGVGMTALAVAAGRAMETKRADALISDPYAAHLVSEADAPVPVPTTLEELAELPQQQAAEDLWTLVSEYVGVRSRAFDDYFAEAAGEGVRQVVILASGLDARPFRLPWSPGTVCYELDHPAVLDFKLGALAKHGIQPRCTHRPVRMDLRDDWATPLKQAGFDPSLPTAWLAEGLLPYLPAEAEEQLFSEVGRLSAAGSRLAVESVHQVPELTAGSVLDGAEEAMGIDIDNLLHGDTRKPSADRLTELGWKSRTVMAEKAAAAYGRRLVHSAALTHHIAHTYAHLP